MSFTAIWISKNAKFSALGTKHASWHQIQSFLGKQPLSKNPRIPIAIRG